MAKIKNGIIKILKAYIQEANKLCLIDKAILFGSYAQGYSNKGSDIDIAIFSKQVTDLNRLEIMTKLFVLVNQFKTDIQPIVFPLQDYFSNENDFIQNEIKNNGVEIPVVKTRQS